MAVTRDGLSAEVSLRPATAADHPFLRNLYGTTRTAELDLTKWNERERQAFLDQQFDFQRRDYEARFPGGHEIILCAGRPIGRLWLDRDRDRWVIVDMALLPQYRDAGVGTAILSDVLAAADDAGVSVRLTVGRYNPRSLRLCARLGFLVRRDDGLHVALERPPGNDCS